MRSDTDREIDSVWRFLGLQSIPHPDGDRGRLSALLHSRHGRRVPGWSVWLFVLTSATAVLAIAGGTALAAGALDGADSIEHRFPWHSPVAAGVALIIVVALPMIVASVELYLVLPGSGRWATGVGCVLIVWIIVEIVVIREFSWLEALFAAVGMLLIIGGRRHTRAAVNRQSAVTGHPGGRN